MSHTVPCDACGRRAHYNGNRHSAQFCDDVCQRLYLRITNKALRETYDHECEQDARESKAVAA